MSNLTPSEGGKITVEITDSKRDKDHVVYTIVTKSLDKDGKQVGIWTAEQRYSEILKVYETVKATVALTCDFPPKKGIMTLLPGTANERKEKLPACLLEMAQKAPTNGELLDLLKVPKPTGTAAPATTPAATPAVVTIAQASMDAMIAEIKKAGFDDDRKAVINKYAATNVFAVDDLKKVIQTLNFDDERMEAIRVLAPKTVLVKTKKQVIIDALNFDDEKQRADSIISAITEITDAPVAGTPAVATATSSKGPVDPDAGRRILLEEARKRIKDSDEGMPQHIFDLLKDRLKGASFTDMKYTVLDCALDSNGINVAQAIELISFFNFSADKVTYTEHLVNHLTNPSKKAELVKQYSGSDATKVQENLNKQTSPAGSFGLPALVLPHTAIRTPAEMEDLTQRIGKEAFSANKVEVMKKEVATRNIGFTADQTVAVLKCYAHSKDMVDVLKLMDPFILGMKCEDIKSVLNAFPFSNDRLEVLREIKKCILDPQDKFIVLDMFVFGADKKTAEEILRDIRPELPAPTSVIYGRVTANDVVFVVDVSGSMSTSFKTSQGEQTNRLQFSVKELKNVLGYLPGGANFNVLAFDTNVYKCFPNLVCANEDNLRAAMKWCDNLRPLQSTNTLGALQAAMQNTSATDIYLLSDGAPDSSPASITSWVKSNNPRNIKIHTIAFLMPGRDPSALSFMKSLAETTNGVYKAVETDH